MEHGQRTAREEWRSGWTLVLASAAGFSFFSIMTTGMGVFMGPLGQEFGWSRTLLSAGLPIAGIVGIVAAPFIGMIIDRHGSRRLALPGLAGMIIVMCAFSTLTGSREQWIGLWVAYALVGLLASVNTWTAPVAGTFHAGRGMALGLTLAGTAVAQAASPVLSSILITHFGWREAFLWLSLGWGGVALLLCFLFLHGPQERRRARPAHESAAEVAALPGLSVREAWRDTALWRIAISTFLLMVLTIGFLVHQVPILIAAGVTAENAAWLAGLGGVAGIVGKLCTGALIDRFRPNWVGGITLGSTALVFALLIDGIRTPAFIVVAILINGYAAGTKLQICSYLTSRYAGLRHFATIFGAMNSLITLGSALGPLAAGLAFDLTGGYAPFLMAGTVGCAFCGLLILTLPRYPDWDAREVAPFAGAPAKA